MLFGCHAYVEGVLSNLDAVHFLLQVDRAKVLSNTIKQKRKEKAGKWEVPLPKVGADTADLPGHTSAGMLLYAGLCQLKGECFGESFRHDAITQTNTLQVRPIAEDEMFKVMRSGKRQKKQWKRMLTKVTFVGGGFTRKPPKYERFIRPTGRQQLQPTHAKFNTVFRCLQNVLPVMVSRLSSRHAG